MEEYKNRKTTRLPEADYNNSNTVFITICTKDRKCTLSKIVGTGVLDGPFVELLPYGKIADKYINQLDDFYNDIFVEAYVIMPNHVHLILIVNHEDNGPSRTPVPTIQNSTVSRFVSTFKRFCNKECGENIWQYRSYDHIIRNPQDHKEHLNYICENSMRWHDDKLYMEE